MTKVQRDSGRVRLMTQACNHTPLFLRITLITVGGVHDGSSTICVISGLFRGVCGLRHRPPRRAVGTRARVVERTLTVDGPVDLSVRSGSGGIQIRTGAGDRVQVIGKVSAGSSRDGLDPAERVRKVEAAPPITQEGNVIRIGETNDDPKYRNVSISYELVVPANTRLDAQTGSGSQTIGSVDGAVRAQTGSGSIGINVPEAACRADR